MLTFTQLYTRAADDVGVSPTISSQNLTNIKQDVNQGLRLFKNAARRYWTRAEKSTDLTANQQYYQLPPDCVRVTQVKVNSNGLVFPVTQIASEEKWNMLNVTPAMTINLPRFFFVRGNGEIGLWPTPTQTVTNGLVISFEPRLVDMVLDDVTSTANSYTKTNPATPVTASVTNGGTTVTLSQSIVTQNMVGQWFQLTDGSDGNWYQITIYNSATSFSIGNDYTGQTAAAAQFAIGQAPDIPEDYHMALVYYAVYQFYLKRKDESTAGTFKGLFEDLLTQYKEVYAVKTTGVVMNNRNATPVSVFSLPPNPIS